MSKNEQISVLIIVSLFCFLSEVCEASKWIQNATESNLVSPKGFWFRHIPKLKHRRYNNGEAFPLNPNEFSHHKKCERYKLSTCVEVLCKQFDCDCEEIYPHKQPFDKECIKGYYANLTCKSCRGGNHCVYFFCKSSSSSDDYSKFFLIAFIVIITACVMSVICCVCCQGRSSLTVFSPTYQRRRRREDRLNRTRLSTSSTIDLLASLDDQPPSYSEIYTVGPQNRDDTSAKLPTYEEALRISNEASININYGSSTVITRTEHANADQPSSTRDEHRPTNNDTERTITI